jgi:hypothetical protein
MVGQASLVAFGHGPFAADATIERMAHPKTIGDRTMLAVMLALHDAGYTVLLPVGENTRYDLVIDDGTSLTRVQCKTGRLRRGAVRFSTCSSYGHHRRSSPTRRDYRGDIDWFAVHCSETEGVSCRSASSRRESRLPCASSRPEIDRDQEFG